MRALIEAFQRVSRQLIEGPPPTFAHQQTRILSQEKPKGVAREAARAAGKKKKKKKKKYKNKKTSRFLRVS